MFMLNDMPEQVSGELLDLLVQCRTETIGHHRHWGFVRGNVRSVLPGRRVVGTAVTVALPGHDSGVLSHALSLLREGDILCIDRLGDTHNACWGGGTTLAAKLTGAAGVVIDGPSTGSSRFNEFDFPAWTSGTSPVTCQMYGNGGALNVPVCVGQNGHPTRIRHSGRRQRSCRPAARGCALSCRDGDRAAEQLPQGV
ncbi:RraA family protein [Nitratireductor aquimarinus]|nr:RraA family protein [Nitratireductor aquimarinus]MBY6134057.1 RraA family protein [Nitratireductor aquimarinus]